MISANDNRLTLEQPISVMVRTLIDENWSEDKKELAIQEAILKRLCQIPTLEVVK